MNQEASRDQPPAGTDNSVDPAPSEPKTEAEDPKSSQEDRTAEKDVKVVQGGDLPKPPEDGDIIIGYHDKGRAAKPTVSKPPKPHRD